MRPSRVLAGAVALALLQSCTSVPLFQRTPNMAALPDATKRLTIEDFYGGGGIAVMTVIAVGSGQCVVISCPNRDKVLNDCGTTSKSKHYEQGITLAASIFSDPGPQGGPAPTRYVVVSHGHQDHYSAIADVVASNDLSALFYGGNWSDYGRKFRKWAEETSLNEPDVPEPAEPTQPEPDPYIFCGVNAGDGLYILAANAGAGKNDQSVVVSLRVGQFSADTMGDAEAGTENYILQRFPKNTNFLPTTYMVAAHHGSSNDSNTAQWAEATIPQAVTFSAGTRYDHPQCISVTNYINAGWIRGTQARPGVVNSHLFSCHPELPDGKDIAAALYNTHDNDSTIVVFTDGSNWQIWRCVNNDPAQCVYSYGATL